ncbi:hypothetical protein AGIG_G21407 [Arapaima gigas]
MTQSEERAWEQQKIVPAKAEGGCKLAGASQPAGLQVTAGVCGAFELPGHQVEWGCVTRSAGAGTHGSAPCGSQQEEDSSSPGR